MLYLFVCCFLFLFALSEAIPVPKRRKRQIGTKKGQIDIKEKIAISWLIKK